MSDEPEEIDSRLRVVITTEVLIEIYLRDAFEPGYPYTGIMEAFYDDEFVMIYCPDTRNELKRMLTDSPVARRYKINATDANEFVEGIFYELGEYVEISGTLRVSPDREDDMFVEAAIAGDVVYLVREDVDFQTRAVVDLLNQHGIRGVFPPEFLDILVARRSAKKT